MADSKPVQPGEKLYLSATEGQKLNRLRKNERIYVIASKTKDSSQKFEFTARGKEYLYLEGAKTHSKQFLIIHSEKNIEDADKCSSLRRSSRSQKCKSARQLLGLSSKNSTVQSSETKQRRRGQLSILVEFSDVHQGVKREEKKVGSSTSDLNTKSLSNLQNRVEKRQPPAEREESCEVTKQNEGLSIDFGEVGEHPKTEALAPATSEQITFPVLRERNIGDESLTEATGLFKENEALLSNVQGDHSTEELPTGKTNTEVSLSKKGNISQNPIQNTELIKEEKNVKGELSRKLVKYSDTDTVKSEAVTSASAVTQSSSGLATAVSFDKNIVLVSIIKSPDNKTGAKGNTEQINTVVCKPESVVIPKGENDSSEEALKETQNKPSKCVIITKASSDHRQTTKDATSGPIKNTSVNVPRIIRIKPGTLPFKLIKTSESQKTIGISGSKSSTMSGTTLVTNPSIAVGSQKVLYTSIQGSNVKGIVYLKSNTLRANDPNSSIDNTSGTFSEENKLSLSENQSEALSSQLESKVDDKIEETCSEKNTSLWNDNHEGPEDSNKTKEQSTEDIMDGTKLVDCGQDIDILEQTVQERSTVMETSKKPSSKGQELSGVPTSSMLSSQGYRKQFTNADLISESMSTGGKHTRSEQILIMPEFQELIDNLKPQANMMAHITVSGSSEGSTDNIRKPVMECKYCKKLIRNKHDFRKHIVSHSEVDFKPWKCPLCDYRALVKSTIRKHINIHSELKPYVCLQCGRGFNFKQKLHLHMKYHQDIREFYCPNCHMAFHEIKTLKNHLANVHDVPCPTDFLKTVNYRVPEERHLKLKSDPEYAMRRTLKHTRKIQTSASTVPPNPVTEKSLRQEETQREQIIYYLESGNPLAANIETDSTQQQALNTNTVLFTPPLSEDTTKPQSAVSENQRLKTTITSCSLPLDSRNVAKNMESINSKVTVQNMHDGITSLPLTQYAVVMNYTDSNAGYSFSSAQGQLLCENQSLSQSNVSQSNISLSSSSHIIDSSADVALNSEDSKVQIQDTLESMTGWLPGESIEFLKREDVKSGGTLLDERTGELIISGDEQNVESGVQGTMGLVKEEKGENVLDAQQFTPVEIIPQPAKSEDTTHGIQSESVQAQQSQRGTKDPVTTHFLILNTSIESKNVDEKPDDLCPSESKKSKILGTPKIKAKTNRFKRLVPIRPSPITQDVKDKDVKKEPLSHTVLQKKHRRNNVKMNCKKITDLQKMEPGVRPFVSVVDDTDGLHSVKLVCKLCSEDGEKEASFRIYSKFLEHLFHEHPALKPFKCPDCGFACRSKANLSSHRKTHQRVKKHVCNICGRGFLFSQKLKVHLRIHANVREHTCDLCNHAFNEKSDLNRHFRKVHMKEKKITCRICNKKYYDITDLKRHMDSHNEDKQYLCPYCCKYYQTRMSLTQHIKSHTCMFHCEICNKDFGSYSGFMAHKVMHDESADGYWCSLCNKKIATKGSHKRHMRVCHSDIRPFTCHLCNKAFKTKKDFKSHELSHGSDKMYLCAVCNFSSTRIDSLKVHMRTHAVVKPFQCGICGKEYTQKAALDQHMILHTEKHKCSICKKNFPSEFLLNQHMIAVHVPMHLRQQVQSSGSMTVFMCEECHSVFVSQEDLSQHIITSHIQEECSTDNGTVSNAMDLDGMELKQDGAAEEASDQLAQVVMADDMQVTDIEGEMSQVECEVVTEDLQVGSLVSITSPSPGQRTKMVSLVHPVGESQPTSTSDTRVLHERDHQHDGMSTEYAELVEIELNQVEGISTSLHETIDIHQTVAGEEFVGHGQSMQGDTREKYVGEAREEACMVDVAAGHHLEIKGSGNIANWVEQQQDQMGLEVKEKGKTTLGVKGESHVSFEVLDQGQVGLEVMDQSSQVFEVKNQGQVGLEVEEESQVSLEIMEQPFQGQVGSQDGEEQTYYTEEFVVVESNELI